MNVARTVVAVLIVGLLVGMLIDDWEKAKR